MQFLMVDKELIIIVVAHPSANITCLVFFLTSIYVQFRISGLELYYLSS